MVPFSKSTVCVCHSTASFMIHSLSFLSLLVFVSDRTFPPLPLPPVCFLCVSVFVLCASCCVPMSNGVPISLFLEVHSSNLWFHLQLIKAATRLKIDGSTIARVTSYSWRLSPKVLFSYFNSELSYFDMKWMNVFFLLVSKCWSIVFSFRKGVIIFQTRVQFSTKLLL